ncbi:MAG: galactokinase [Acidobacteria bacterium]|nr:galactokinase [Acidobacteriota bacterium]
MSTPKSRRVFAPGRVNLIGDHVDYVGGLVLPMAVDLGTTIEVVPRADGQVLLTSENDPRPVRLTLPVRDVTEVEPQWGRFVAAVLAEMGAVDGFEGSVSSSLPIGAGMSSSSALSAAVAMAAGYEGAAIELARLCRRAETTASGVPCGIMDQLTIAAATKGTALAIDCRDESFRPIALPDKCSVFIAHCGVSRSLVESAYAERRAACEDAESQIGALRDASLSNVASLEDPLLRIRARHVVSEIARVEAAIDACVRGDPAEIGRLMIESHESLRDDFEVSIDELDRLVDRLCGIEGVYGARLTGAGFGGCVVALTHEEVDAVDVAGEAQSWRVVASDGVRNLHD